MDYFGKCVWMLAKKDIQWHLSSEALAGKQYMLRFSTRGNLE
jgi:hypothetical protein